MTGPIYREVLSEICQRCSILQTTTNLAYGLPLKFNVLFVLAHFGTGGSGLLVLHDLILLCTGSPTTR